MEKEMPTNPMVIFFSIYLGMTIDSRWWLGKNIHKWFKRGQLQKTWCHGHGCFFLETDTVMMLKQQEFGTLFLGGSFPRHHWFHNLCGFLWSWLRKSLALCPMAASSLQVPAMWATAAPFVTDLATCEERRDVRRCREAIPNVAEAICFKLLGCTRLR